MPLLILHVLMAAPAPLMPEKSPFFRVSWPEINKTTDEDLLKLTADTTTCADMTEQKGAAFFDCSTQSRENAFAGLISRMKAVYPYTLHRGRVPLPPTHPRQATKQPSHLCVHLTASNGTRSSQSTRTA